MQNEALALTTNLGERGAAILPTLVTVSVSEQRGCFGSMNFGVAKSLQNFGTEGP